MKVMTHKEAIMSFLESKPFVELSVEEICIGSYAIKNGEVTLSKHHNIKSVEPTLITLMKDEDSNVYRTDSKMVSYRFIPEYDRDGIEDAGKSELTKTELRCYNAYWTLTKDIKAWGYSGFDVDHANTMIEHKVEAIHPSNLQILTSGDNRNKGGISSNSRMTWERQVRYIKEAVSWRAEENDLDMEELDYILSAFRTTYEYFQNDC